MKSNKNKPFRLRFFWPFSIFLGILFFLLGGLILAGLEVLKTRLEK